MIKIKNTLHKLTHWEYWNTYIVYFPIYFYWIYLSIKARSLGFFNASNPRIINGGFAMESKKEIYDLIPNQYIPETLLFKSGTSLEAIKTELQHTNLLFPLIIKPDIGLQGLRVEKIENWDALEYYLKNVNYDFLIQEFINYDLEIGLFYYRMPYETKGVISGIVYKDFLIVKGNGKHTITELIHENPRFLLQLDTLKNKYGDFLESILLKDEVFNLMPFGNHVRGSKFTDVSDWANNTLTNTFDDICKQIPDFHFGRLDIKFHSREDLEVGKNFSIIELNGAGSEPTHIYDPKHSIFFAWKEIIKHYNILYKISTYNLKKGSRYLTFSESIKMIKGNNSLRKNLKLLS
ncbi:D-alanine--D-alanine ligase [uncultured Formosa sp.]|uniref:D-alanine--D-alanine ligase n=1 Tax=uncultured Formosa sp. TaxID=255435 RepID=UPI00263416CC|nr:D-alanine--D-alanine ligase [uncultured Formosa sp.]